MSAPAVDEIVFIDEALADAQPEISQPHPARFDAAIGAVVAPLDHEAVEVLITPAQSHLQGGMQVGDGAVAADEEPAPDQRADPAQDDPQLVDHRGSGLTKLRHAAIMARVAPSPVAPRATTR